MPWPRSHVSPQMSVAFLVLHVIAIRLPSKVVSMAWPRSITAVLRQRGRLPEYAIAYGWVGFLLTARPFRAQAWCPRLWSSCLWTGESQINFGELIAALSAIFSLRHELKGRRILHFVDHQGALAF